jgi:hypothetical protein
MLFSAVCLFIVFSATPSIIDKFELYMSGIKTEAKILHVSSHTETYIDSDGHSRRKNYDKVKYQFTTEDGKNINNEVVVSGGIGSDQRKGGNIKIIYDSNDPSKNQPYDNLLESSLLSLLIFLFPAIEIVMLYFCIKRANRINRLFRIGMETKANVSYIRVTGRKNNKPSSATVEYTFKDGNNKNYEGRTKSAPYKNTHNITIGDEINILYNPKNPKETVWIDGYC